MDRGLELMAACRRRSARRGGRRAPAVALLAAGALLLMTGSCGNAGRGDRRAAAGAVPAGEAGVARGDSLALEFSVRGGFAGFQLDLSITPGGSAALLDRGRPAGQTRLAATARDTLRRLLEAAAPASPDRAAITYGRPGRVADGWERTLTVRGGGQAWTIREITDPDNLPPPPVAALFEWLMERTMRLRAAAASGS